MVSELFRTNLVSEQTICNLCRQHFFGVQTLNWWRLACYERPLHWGLRRRPLCCVLWGFSKDSQSDWLRVNLIQTKNTEFYYLQIIQNWFTFTLDVATQMQFSWNKKVTLHNLIIPPIHRVVKFWFLFANGFYILPLNNQLYHPRVSTRCQMLIGKLYTPRINVFA